MGLIDLLQKKLRPYILAGSLGLGLLVTSGCDDGSSSYRNSASSKKNITLVEDINGDSIKDILYVSPSEMYVHTGVITKSELKVKFGQKDGNFEQETTLRSFFMAPLEIKLEDLDNDGIKDLLITEVTEAYDYKNIPTKSRLVCMRGNKDGTFKEAQTITEYFGSPSGLNNSQ